MALYWPRKATPDPHAYPIWESRVATEADVRWLAPRLTSAALDEIEAASKYQPVTALLMDLPAKLVISDNRRPAQPDAILYIHPDEGQPTAGFWCAVRTPSAVRMALVVHVLRHPYPRPLQQHLPHPAHLGRCKECGSGGIGRTSRLQTFYDRSIWAERITLPLSKKECRPLCDPVTLTAITLGVSAGSAGLGVIGQMQQNAEAKGAFNNQTRQTDIGTQQQETADSVKAQQTQKQMLEAAATAKQSAGETGTAGNSVDALINDYHATEGQYMSNLATQQQWNRSQAGVQKQGFRARRNLGWFHLSQLI
jgi:hypothetical protein